LYPHNTCEQTFSLMKMNKSDTRTQRQYLHKYTKNLWAAATLSRIISRYSKYLLPFWHNVFSLRPSTSHETSYSALQRKLLPVSGSDLRTSGSTYPLNHCSRVLLFNVYLVAHIFWTTVLMSYLFNTYLVARIFWTTVLVSYLFNTYLVARIFWTTVLMYYLTSCCTYLLNHCTRVLFI